MKIKRISNNHINSYLWERGYLPIRENGNECFYEKTDLLLGLLEDYFIQYVAIPNKL